MGYIYQADVYCDTCGEEIRRAIDKTGQAPEEPEDERTYDSGEYPKGFLNEQEESDCPDNCAGCGEFLRNPLTSEGYRYLKEMLDNHGKTLPDAAREWADYYSFRWQETCLQCGLEADSDCECEAPEVRGEWVSPEMF